MARTRRAGNLENVREAMIATTQGSSQERPYLNRLLFRLRELLLQKLQAFRVSGSTAQNLAHVASGRLDVYFDEHGFGGPWDVAAGIVLVTEAGGVLRSIQGGQYQFQMGQGDLICGNAVGGGVVGWGGSTVTGLALAKKPVRDSAELGLRAVLERPDLVEALKQLVGAPFVSLHAHVSAPATVKVRAACFVGFAALAKGVTLPARTLVALELLPYGSFWPLALTADAVRELKAHVATLDQPSCLILHPTDNTAIDEEQPPFPEGMDVWTAASSDELLQKLDKEKAAQQE